MKFTLARVLSAVVAAAGVGFPVTATAQPAESATPAYSRPSYASDEETIKGRIASINGYRMEVRDDRGFVDNVELHQGTVINPTGLTLGPGMSVTVFGYSRGQMFAANEIDTPYSSYAAFPAYYPYPFYGPPISVGLRFGGGFHHFHHFR